MHGVPKGRLNRRPPTIQPCLRHWMLGGLGNPALKCWANFTASLRDARREPGNVTGASVSDFLRYGAGLATASSLGRRAGRRIAKEMLQLGELVRVDKV